MKTFIMIGWFFVIIVVIRFVIKIVWGGSYEKKISFESIKNDIARGKLQCPKCRLNPDKLNWFKFRTSNASWRHLVGRKGFLSKCPDCEIVVQEIIIVMN